MAVFDESANDSTSYPPCVLHDARGESGQVFLAFSETAYTTLGALGYPTDGHAMRSFVIAAREHAGLDGEPDNIVYEAEFDQCFLIIDDLAAADTTASVISRAFDDPSTLERIASAATEHSR
ncbi:hypothetical protein [Agromyces cerinus]|uniref:Immunity protein 51 n=1 Tax=Agromyces cerinus subsp. cerinus TaxID=232089 RepID=A0A1N6IBW4_9MICO|nr:hypothetical protein [Agromyces cerinus]SIO29538.1 hypothetical protein SAMN05443544_3885 [Agromyces cerinus subsp. cerinus]